MFTRSPSRMSDAQWYWFRKFNPSYQDADRPAVEAFRWEIGIQAFNALYKVDDEDRDDRRRQDPTNPFSPLLQNFVGPRDLSQHSLADFLITDTEPIDVTCSYHQQADQAAKFTGVIWAFPEPDRYLLWNVGCAIDRRNEHGDWRTVIPGGKEIAEAFHHLFGKYSQTDGADSALRKTLHRRYFGSPGRRQGGRTDGLYQQYVALSHAPCELVCQLARITASHPISLLSGDPIGVQLYWGECYAKLYEPESYGFGYSKEQRDEYYGLRPQKWAKQRELLAAVVRTVLHDKLNMKTRGRRISDPGEIAWESPYKVERTVFDLLPEANAHWEEHGYPEDEPLKVKSACCGAPLRRDQIPTPRRPRAADVLQDRSSSSSP